MVEKMTTINGEVLIGKKPSILTEIFIERSSNNCIGIYFF